MSKAKGMFQASTPAEAASTPAKALKRKLARAGQELQVLRLSDLEEELAALHVQELPSKKPSTAGKCIDSISAETSNLCYHCLLIVHYRSSCCRRGAPSEN